MIVCYTPKHNHNVINDFTFMEHTSLKRPYKGDFMDGIHEAFATPDRYGPSTCIWIVPGTYHGE